MLGVIALLALTGCSKNDSSQFGRLGLPRPASDRTTAMFNLWLAGWTAVLVIFVLVFGLIVWSVVRYRRRSPDDTPAQVRYNLPIEMLYTIAPVVIVAVFFVHTVQAQDAMLKNVPTQHTIIVVGEKWAWTFDYVKDKALDGKTTVYDTGTPDAPATLYLPLNQPVRFDLHSPDVIHSFWIPAFYFKMDVIPGRSNTYTMTANRLGTYAGHCAELCGLYHSRMIFTVKVVTPQQYAAHLKALADPNGIDQIGQPMGNSNTDTIAGLTPESGGGQ
ncbi:MAG: aa3-type cytochrome oxidase subunit II [Nocardioidaceae bacterium]